MVSDGSSSRLRALLWVAPITVVITLTVLLAATRTGHYAGEWFVSMVEQRPVAVALGLMCLSGLPLLFVTRAERRRAKASVN